MTNVRYKFDKNLESKKLNMKNASVVCFCFFSLLSANGVDAKAPILAVTLEQAYQMSLQQTETEALGQSRIDQADAKVGQYRASFLPQADLETSYDWQDPNTHSTKSSSSTSHTSYTRLALTQSLFNGGKDWAAWKGQVHIRRSQEQSLSAEKSKMYLSVAQAFYEVLSDQSELRILQEMMRLARERMKTIQERTQIGRSRNIDLLAAQAQLATLQTQITALTGQMSSAYDKLSALTGLESESSVLEATSELPQPGNLQEYEAQTDKRADIQSLQEKVESAQVGVTEALGGHLPALDFSSHFYLSRKGSQEGNDWDVALGLTLPLFSGGEVMEQHREAVAARTESELQLRSDRRQAHLEVNQAYHLVTSSLEQQKSLQLALQAIEKNYKEQENNYRFGQASNLDVIQALNSYQDIKRSSERNRYQVMSAWAQLQVVSGHLP